MIKRKVFCNEAENFRASTLVIVRNLHTTHVQEVVIRNSFETLMLCPDSGVVFVAAQCRLDIQAFIRLEVI